MGLAGSPQTQVELQFLCLLALRPLYIALTSLSPFLHQLKRGGLSLLRLLENDSNLVCSFKKQTITISVISRKVIRGFEFWS